ncbi:hypothetical protein NQ315_013915 [Exocentrus adspersus]|uniref:Uncharacterized protein n=1 Tax=Exocentrus adspersus TaxID=1586481 RepID=A0AAV8VQH7_9CUCU|nr:hypothetical protein NQ315_013915 [Exocentrus adspersus]
MADENFNVRLEERLKIKIGEAKNLQARTHGSSTQRDVYCTLSLDQEEIFRTSTVYQTLRHLKQDKVLGKVAIRREQLASYNNKDHWFPIKAVDADSEVQGKANIEIRFESEFEHGFNNKHKTSSYSSCRKLLVQVVKCLDLTLKNGACDPYALVSVTYTNGKRISKRTKVRKKTTSPQFDEVFTFYNSDGRDNVCESDSEICELHVSIWHDTPGMSDDVFLGEVRVQLRGMQQQNAAHRNAWFLAVNAQITVRRPSNRVCRVPEIACDILSTFSYFNYNYEKRDCQTNRTLTLISKTIQSLGNLVSCRSTQQVCKEEYMECLYKAFYTESHMTAMRQFLEIISANTSPQTIESDTPVTLKEGLMIKRAQGRKRFGRKNFKQRYFKLTTHDLSYSKSRGRDALCQIPLSNILAVERLAETSFKMKNMFQIVQPERALYVQATNCVEEKEWVDLLTKICQTNSNRLQKYHPSAFINGQWLCCKSPNELAPGCSEVSRTDNNYHMTLDPERDLQRIHSLIIAHINTLDTCINMCQNETICNILKQLREVAYQIEQKHRTYKRTLDRSIKYGSL